MSQEQPPMRVNTAFPKNSLDMLPTAGSSNAQNILKPWVHEMLEKSKAHRERMLQLDCLLKLYKCMENNCSFATAHANKMAEHIRHHPMARFLPCAYCSDWFHSEATIGHVDKEHGLSKFQCRHCFFRAFDAHCVWLHQKFYHPNAQDGDILDILPNECIFQRMKLMNDISSRFATALRSLECTDCKHKMLTLPTFESHINHIEGPIVRCQFCNKSFLKTAIIQHLLRHDIGVFECIYCNHAVTDITYMQLHIINSHSSKPMYYISRLRTCQTSEFSETKSDMLKMMSAKGIVKVVPIRQAHQQHANNSNQFSSDVGIFDTEEGTQKNDKSRKAEPLESVTSDESIKPFSTPASIETSAMTAPCRSRPKKDPMLPIIAKIEGGVQFSCNGDIIGVKESFTTMPPKKYITKTSTKPMEANQQLPITAIPSKVIKHKEELNVATGTSALQQASDSISTDAPMTNVIRDPKDSHLERAKISSDSKSSWKLNDASNKPSSSCAEIVKICLPKAIALDQGPDIQKPELPAIIVSKTKEKTIQIIADRSVDQCKANVLETHGVPSQRRKRQAGIVASRNKTNIAIHYLLHDCNLLIEEFLGALKRRLAKTEIDGSFGLKDGLRCYCCLLCYHSSYNMFKLGEHYQIQHHIIDLTVSLVHPDHDSLHSSIVLMLPTRMDFEKKLAKMEELIRLEEEHEVHLQKGARLLDEPKQQEVEASPSQALVGNDTAKVKCYPGARSKANTIPKPCSVRSNKLAKKYPGYQSHIKICGVYNNSLFDCPGARSKANTIPKPCSVGSDELAKKYPGYQSHIKICGVYNNSLLDCPDCAIVLNCAESVATVFNHLNSHQVFLFNTIETLAEQIIAQQKIANDHPYGMSATRLDGRNFVCFLCYYSNTELSKTAQHIVSYHHFKSALEYCFVRSELKYQRKKNLLVYPSSLCGPIKLTRIFELLSFEQCNTNTVPNNSTAVSPGTESRSINVGLETIIPMNIVDKANCGQLYKCGFCLDQTPKSRLQLLLHIGTKCMFKGIDYPCAHCDEMLACRTDESNDFNADIIFEHLYYHGENLYRCSVCGFIHYKRTMIKKHLIREHHQHDGVVVVRESSVWWDCSLCDLRTRYRQTIMEHMMTKHNLPGERYMCGHCRESDYNTQYFKAHMAIRHPQVAADKLQIIEMYTSVAVKDEDANTSGTIDTSVTIGCHDGDAQQSITEPIRASSIPTGSAKNFSPQSQNDGCSEKSISQTKKSIKIEKECGGSSPICSITGSAVQQPVSAAPTNESKDRSVSNLLEAAPSFNPKIEKTNVVQEKYLPLQVDDNEDMYILKSILPEGTPLTKTKFGVRLRLESPTTESKPEASKPLLEMSGMANDFFLKDMKVEEMMEHSQRTDEMGIEIVSEKQPTSTTTSRRSTRVAMQKDATQQWSYSTVFACYFCKQQYNCFDNLKTHTSAKHTGQELLSFVATGDSLKCVFTLLPLLRCFYCMGNTVGTYDELQAHCKEEHARKTFACVDFWNVFKCGFCPYLNGSGVQKEIREHFMVNHYNDATIARSSDHVDDDFLAWALRCDTIQANNGSVEKAELVRFLCNRCGAHADSEESLGEHMAYHLFHFVCPHCSSAFKELKVLYEHVTIMHAQNDLSVPRAFNTVPHYKQLFETMAMFSNGLILSKRELLTTRSLSYMRNLSKGIQISYRRQLADLAQYKSDLQLPLETPSGEESEGETCAMFIKKQLFYPALIISQVITTEVKHDNELHAQVKSEDSNIKKAADHSNTKRIRRACRL